MANFKQAAILQKSWIFNYGLLWAGISQVQTGSSILLG